MSDARNGDMTRERIPLPRYVTYGLAAGPAMFALYVAVLWLCRHPLGLIPRIVWARGAGPSEFRVFIVASGITLTYFISIWYALQRIKRRLGLSRLVAVLFTSVICAMLVWASVLGLSGSVLNRVLDPSPPAVHQAQVLSVATERSWPGGPDRLLEVRSWRREGGVERIRVLGSKRALPAPGGWVTVTTRAGLFGIPWIADLKPGPAPDEPTGPVKER